MNEKNCDMASKSEKTDCIVQNCDCNTGNSQYYNTYLKVWMYSNVFHVFHDSPPVNLYILVQSSI